MTLLRYVNIPSIKMPSFESSFKIQEIHAWHFFWICCLQVISAWYLFSVCFLVCWLVGWFNSVVTYLFFAPFLFAGSGECHLNDLTCTSTEHKRCKSFRGKEELQHSILVTTFISFMSTNEVLLDFQTLISLVNAFF